MWKKIMLGFIVGIVVLTVGAGTIYAYQKNSDKENAAITAKYTGYGKSMENRKMSDCVNYDCTYENCQNRYCKTENNCYCYSNGENGYCRQNNYCHSNNNEDQLTGQNRKMNKENNRQCHR
ncbi:MAG: hypothetical protein PHR39_08290 [Actinomycetota bacterium]|nr:hypothetical protein [Actinomycetota bacterium]